MHFEIGCKAKDATTQFYREAFGWKTEAYGDAAMVNTGSETGIQGHINSLGHEPHQYVTFYIQVDDIEASLTKIEGLGGKIVVPATEVPNMGHFAWFSDPEGNVLGLWQSMAAR
jgi:predicted enzyme related to lactoylglutathione lyase